MNNSVAAGPESCQVRVVFLDPIPGIIPFGSVTVVAGASGAGKTIFMAEAIARMQTGRTFCGHKTNPCTGYGVIAADRDWSTYALAYKHAGYPEIARYVLAEDPDFDPRSWGRKSSAFTLLEESLKRLNPQPGWIVYVDPVAPLFIQGNQNDARDVALSLHWYRRLARQYQITIVVFANVGKQKAEDTYRRAQDRIAGSGAFVAYSDTQISVEQDDKKILTISLTPRHGPGEEHYFTFNPETHLFAPVADRTSTVEGTTLAPHLARIFELIPTDGIFLHLLVKAAEKQLGVKKTQVYANVRSLMASGVLVQDEEGKIRRKKAH